LSDAFPASLMLAPRHWDGVWGNCSFYGGWLHQLEVWLGFNVRLPADRLVDAVRWIDGQEPNSKLPLGLFGVSTRAAAAPLGDAARA
jgi:hypothetical protein